MVYRALKHECISFWYSGLKSALLSVRHILRIQGKELFMFTITWACSPTAVFTISINELVDHYKSCLLFGWATHALSIGDRPLVAKGIEIQNKGRKLTFLSRLQVISLKQYFGRLVGFVLKQLDNVLALRYLWAIINSTALRWLYLLIDNLESLLKC